MRAVAFHDRCIAPVVAGYSLLLLLTNWSLTRTERVMDGTPGVTSETDLRKTGLLLGTVASLAFLWLIWRRVRLLLDAGIRVPRNVKLRGDCYHLCFLFFMIFSFSYQTSSHEDMLLTLTRFEYGGGDAMVSSIIASACAIMLFQTHRRLKAIPLPAAPAIAPPPQAAPASVFQAVH